MYHDSDSPITSTKKTKMRLVFLNFIPLCEWTWCHCVSYVMQNQNVSTIVNSWENMRRTTKCVVEMLPRIYRLITAYLLLRVNLDKIMHAHWDFDASSARTQRVSALDKHQNWSASALFRLNSQAQSKYAVVNLIHTQRKQTFLSFIMW